MRTGSWRTAAVLTFALATVWTTAGAEVGSVVPEEWAALEAAIADLAQTFGSDYPGDKFREGLQTMRAQAGATTDPAAADAFRRLRRDALLANPLLDFDEVLLVRRQVHQLGLPLNWQGNSSLPPRGYDNEIVRLPLREPSAPLQTVYRPAEDVFVGDVDLHFDADRILFSMPEPSGRWRVHELTLDGSPPRNLRLIDEPDVDNYDACYLADGSILFCSTATMLGVPCVRGSDHVCNLYRWDPSPGGVRRLTFDQDHNWCPTPLPDGRVLYLRWEYSDIPHFVSRILFQMNPDGTGQAAYYGSNSYWPNAMFYARPIPGQANRFVAIVGGHHDVPRMGELVLFDTDLGRREAEGAIQRIPGRGRPVEPVIRDALVEHSWPKFLHPWPLSEKYFLVSMQPAAGADWGLYLVDVFDNLVQLRTDPGYALLEPVPLRPSTHPPVIPARAHPGDDTATVYLADIYKGNGLQGVPRGAVRQLRLVTYNFSYRGMGGQIDRVGLDGPWDIKRVLGTVPVEPDGSALFQVPANTPISVQPLDEEGKAMQLMRSWMTAMPGEILSCIGCHEDPNTSPPTARTLAQQRPPSAITPWYGPPRGFSFNREVQPVLDRHCVACHDGRPAPQGDALADFSGGRSVPPPGEANIYQDGRHFPAAYLNLRRYVRSPTIESDMHLLPPMEFHADTSELVQRLKQGHHGVELDREDWDRLITWIDLHTPAHGTWVEIVGPDRMGGLPARRAELVARYAGVRENPEWIPEVTAAPAVADAPVAWPTLPAPSPAAPPPDAPPSPPTERILDLGGGLTLRLCLVPAGEALIGSEQGFPDEAPVRRVRVERPFWMGACEITNEQFARFDPRHDSRLEHGDFLQFSEQERGYPLNLPGQPVVRISWEQATAYCRWLSERTGEPFDLPTEEEWEYACRAGRPTPLWFGAESDDFAPFENLADACLQSVATYDPWALPSGAVAPWRPAAANVNDGFRVSAPVGRFRPNPWGLYDMHGNVAEWTSSPFRSPAKPALGPATRAERMVVRGGSWYSRPELARASQRTAYPSWQRVFNVGFRVATPSSQVKVIVDDVFDTGTRPIGPSGAFPGPPEKPAPPLGLRDLPRIRSLAVRNTLH